ncbi:diguanylate cyclase domain-containing protein [Kineothrix sp. MB12-C1]|uniref:diguanylate cyclase domain-containing protein n=1 Tax=Kineothrix sp. MB12-C1 TaxID=3070215 RepID=UPI0027D28023|nr:diguanylate cyclase [Kineothrix sp. MB12-C1]WMC93725.1 diguanylate cyclase [Kineothrix sp. MB12-C1]
MKNKRLSLGADIAYMILLVMLFVCVAFIVFSENVSFNVAALCIVFAILIISHFTAVTFGLILNTVVIFAGFSWYLYRQFSYGIPIQSDFYFWVIVTPLLTVISNTIFRNMLQIEEENIKLRKWAQHFSIVDDMTELKNIQAYEMEFPVYQRIAARYKIGFMLIVWQFRYADDLKRIIGKKGMEQTVAELSKVMANTFRREDVVYILSKDPYEWGILLLTNENSEELLKTRIKEKMQEMDFSEILGKNAPRLDVRVGVHFIEEDEDTPLLALEKAKNKLQYDV